MSSFVCICDYYVTVYYYAQRNIKTTEIKSLTPFEPFLTFLKPRAPPTNVDTVAITSRMSLYTVMRLVDELKNMGYKNIEVLEHDFFLLQSTVNKNRLRFKEGEHLFYCDELCYLFQYANGILRYQYAKSPNESEFNQIVKKLEAEKSLRYVLLDNDNDSEKAVHFRSTELVLCENDSSDHDDMNTLIWMKTSCTTPRVMVQHYTHCGPRLTCDGNCIFDKTQTGVSLPFEWTSEPNLQTTTATVELKDWTETITAPKNKNYRIVLNLDSNGFPDFRFETTANLNNNLFMAKDLPEVGMALFISLADDSFSVSKDGQTFKKSNPNSDIVFSDVVAMLDPEAPPRKQWMKYSTNFCTEYLTSQLGEDGTYHAVSAVTIMSQLFQAAIEEFRVDKHELVLVVPSSFNERQQTALLKAGKEICDRVFLVDKLEALLAGMAVKQNLSAGDKMIILNDRSLVVTEFTENDAKVLYEQKNIDFLGEIIGKNEGVPGSQPSSDSDGSNQFNIPGPTLEKLRICLHKSCKLSKMHADEVKMILMPSECMNASFLSGMLNWMFPEAQITTLSCSLLSTLAIDDGVVKSK